MKTLTINQQNELRTIFTDRVSFDTHERKLYGHDAGTMPPLMRPLIGDTTPCAVVQPENEAELIALVRFANESGISITPRGRATAGYGGAVPMRGGVVVDFSHMRRLLGVTAALRGEDCTVIVEPGMIWSDLEKELNKVGLALRLYPSSAPGSTVGGWLAQGGAGIGSYQYGYFGENVVSARVVAPNGELQTYSGDDLKNISEANGITGLITRVELRVRTHKEIGVVAYGFRTIESLTSLLDAIQAESLPIWSATFFDPTMARFKNYTALKRGHDKIENESPELPDVYVALFAYCKSKEAQLETRLDHLAVPFGVRLSDRIAQHEWAERFNPMRLKRLGPSLIPAEAIVPLNKLSEFKFELNQRIEHALALEATVIKGDQVALLGLIPHDERSVKYDFAYALSLTFLNTAKNFGGRAYSTGLYFAQERNSVLGAERAESLKRSKLSIDPNNIMNPGKVISDQPINWAIKFASRLEPAARWLGNLAQVDLGERPKAAKGLPAQVAWNAFACAQCGYCVDSCTLYQGRGWESASPRGKFFYLRELLQGKEKLDQQMVDTFLLCTTCERCNVACQLGMEIEPTWGLMRDNLVTQRGFQTFPPFEIMKASLDKDQNIWAAFKQDRAAWLPEDIKPKIKNKAKIGYFAGCTASYVEPDIAQSAVRLLDKAGVEFTYLGADEYCCGIPMLVAGLTEDFKKAMRHNIAKMQEKGVETVVTSCPACWLSWHKYYPDNAKEFGIEFPFEVKHYSQVLADKINSGELKFPNPVNAKVTWHDSCHIGRAGGVYEEPRKLIRATGAKLVEMEHNREDALCCGSVLTRIGEPEPTSNIIGEKKIDEIIATGADTVLALCPCCQFQMRVTARTLGKNVKVQDLAAFTANALGMETEAPDDYVWEMWLVFDKFIKLMTPREMAKLMGAMMSEMVNAMPGPFPSMMHLMQRAPRFAIDAMMSVMRVAATPMFQLMMPRMMPKVMPAMLERVREMIPMPDYMQKQMPDLMPRVMERVMPKMLSTVVPYVLPAMQEYLVNGRFSKN